MIIVKLKIMGRHGDMSLLLADYHPATVVCIKLARLGEVWRVVLVFWIVSGLVT